MLTCLILIHCTLFLYFVHHNEDNDTNLEFMPAKPPYFRQLAHSTPRASLVTITMYSFSIFLTSFVFCLCSSVVNCDVDKFVVGGVQNAMTHDSPKGLLKNGYKCSKALLNLSWKVSPDAHLRTPELIAKYGYPVETHQVTTEDGYILTLFRIPYGKKGGTRRRATGGRRPVAFVMHGMLASSSDWLMNPEESALPYMLANAGYDVWLGNARGTDYSQGHTRLSVDDLAYWMFSWDEMGRYDIPAVIDYILETTGEPKLFYIGHSMGTTMFFVCMDARPEYNAKIRSMYAMSPAAFVGNMLSPLALFSRFSKKVEAMSDLIGGGRLIPDLALKSVTSFGPLLCAPSPLAMSICGSFFFAIAGFDPCQFNTTEEISNIVGHTPNTLSARTFTHFTQLVKSKRFRRFDHGKEGNRKAYGGRSTPPDYNLTNVAAKVAAFWGQNDLLSVPEDVARDVSQLPNVIANRRVNFDLWSHLDFTYAIDAKELLYNQVLALMRRNYK